MKSIANTLQRKSATLSNYKQIHHFTKLAFKILILQLNILIKFKVEGIEYSEIDILYRNDRLMNANRFSEIIIPFQDALPLKCVKFRNSSISISCYNYSTSLTQERKIGLNQDSFQQTYILPKIESWDHLKNLVTLAQSAGLTTVQYKWVADFPLGENSSTFYNLVEIVKSTSFRAVNPFTIAFSNANEADTANFMTKGIKAFNLDIVNPQTQVQSLDSILNIQQSPNNILSGSTLQVGGVVHDLYDYDTKIELGLDNRPIFVSGFAVEVLRSLEEILNFSSNAVMYDEWGYKDSKLGEWVGIVNGILKGEVDLGISSCASMASRRDVVDFNMHTHVNKLTTFFKRYSGQPLNPLLMPFQNVFWFSILIWLCFCRIIYTIFQYFIYYYLNIDDDSSLSQGDLVPWMFAPITYRGIPEPPNLIPLQALYFFELIVTVIINSAFSGTLIASLSMDYNPIKTVGDVLNFDYNIELLDYKIVMDDLKDSNDSLANNLYQRSQQYKRPNKATERPMQEVVRGKLAYVIHDLSGFDEMYRLLLPLEACNVQYIPMDDYILKQGSFVGKGSQLKGIIDHGLLKMMETGITALIRLRYLYRGPNCNNHIEFSGADIYDLQLAFFMLVIVYSASVAICVVENIWFNYNHNFRMIL